ncbi:hypothetical protein CC78DRAFT_581461 [Lojkania enalia]|uniref:Uncharacterized protein n=1 Tax=Lojkania enalia TaxID=147567 RepID=A0A9P4K806_9PLEO|nr:hypothetical protein CC78DRAFT_581461 [Didymosphaeria enalia]
MSRARRIPLFWVLLPAAHYRGACRHGRIHGREPLVSQSKTPVPTYSTPSGAAEGPRGAYASNDADEKCRVRLYAPHEPRCNELAWFEVEEPTNPESNNRRLLSTPHHLDASS